MTNSWAEPVSRLLVFDNLDSDDAEKVLDQWRPKMSGARVLVTSRRDEWDKASGVNRISLGLLTRAESVALLKKFLKDLDEGTADQIADVMGDLPLALHLAGSYLDYYKGDITPKEYLEEWQSEKLKHESMAGEWLEFKPTGRELHLFNTFMLSYRRLSNTVLPYLLGPITYCLTVDNSA